MAYGGNQRSRLTFLDAENWIRSDWTGLDCWTGLTLAPGQLRRLPRAFGRQAQSKGERFSERNENEQENYEPCYCNPRDRKLLIVHTSDYYCLS